MGIINFLLAGLLGGKGVVELVQDDPRNVGIYLIAGAIILLGNGILDQVRDYRRSKERR